MLLPAMFKGALTAGRADDECCRSMQTVLAGVVSKPQRLLSSLVGGALRNVHSTKEG